MQVFKLYLKILNKHKGQIFLYIGIFAGIMFGFIIPNGSKNTVEDFASSTVKYAIFDYDDSELSKGMCEFLEENHTLREIKSDDEEIIQDALYNMDVACVVRINEGFEKAFSEGKGKEKLDFYRINGTTTAMLLESDLNGFLKFIDTYVSAGYSMKDSVDYAIEIEKTQIDVSLPDGENVSEFNSLQMFFSYQPWVFIVMCVCAISPIIIILDKKALRERIEVSSYKFSRMNFEILLGVLVTGVAICVVFIGMAIALFGSDLSLTQIGLYVANMLAMMMVALSITYFVGKVATKEEVVSLLANVISLGMAFLSGVFVPLQYLSDTVIKIAHFLPAYWYELAVNNITSYNSDKLMQTFGYMGIQLLFALAITIVGMIVARKKAYV